MKFNPSHPVPCVYLKHGAYWLVKRGKWERIGKTLPEAMAEYCRREQAPKAGALPKLIEETMLAHVKAKRLSAATAAQYKIAAEVLKRRLKAFDTPDQVKGRHVAQIKTEGADHPNMTNRTISLLRTLFSIWMEHQKVDSNPCVGVRRHEEAKRARRLTSSEWLAIHERAGPRLRAIMKMAYLTGQRINDVLKLRRSQLTEKGVEFTQQKTGARLTVKWSPDLRAAVDEALALHGGVPALTLFIGRNGKPPNYRSVHDQWAAACKAAGVEDARPNDQRAQSLTDTKRQGKDPTALAGHTTKAMTDRYLRDRESPEVDGPSLRQALDVGRKG